MLLPTTLLFLASNALALALPTSPLTARAAPSVYLCNDRDFTGYCKSISAPSGTCVPLASDFNDKLSSVGPDKGFLCYFFVDAGCSTNADFFHVGNPGVARLNVTPVNGPAGSTRNFEDKLSSYFCVNE